jgi:hypothetical protein
VSRWLLPCIALVPVVPLLFVALAMGQERIESSPVQGDDPRDVSRDDLNRDDTKRDGTKGDDVKKPLNKDGLVDKKGRPRNPPGALPVFTPEGEAAALKFVGENHRELAALLKQLKANSPEEYKRAIRELFRTTEKLAQTKSTDVDRYDLDLEGWKIDSEIRLLAAKLTMGDDEELRGKLRKQFAKKNKLQVQRLELEKRRAEQRLKKIDENIEKLKRDQDQIADRQMTEILRTVRKERPAKRARSAAVRSSEKTDRRDGAERVEKVDPAVTPQRD